MSYQIVLSSAAKRDLNKIPPKILPALIEFIQGPLADNPQRVGKPLHDELDGSYSARRGSYRVIYEIHDDRIEVQVLTIDHRSTVYRNRG